MNAQVERMQDTIISLTRLLQDASNATSPPSVTPSPSKPSASTRQSFLGWLSILMIALVGGFVAWRCGVRWRLRREQRLLQYRAAEANRVLGDMQMVPNDDLDDGLI